MEKIIEKISLKRTIIAFAVYCVVCIGCGIRLYTIATGTLSTAATAQSRYTVTLDTLRGTVYDRNMSPITNSQSVTVASLTPSPDTLEQIHSLYRGEELQSMLELLKSGKPVVTAVPSEFSASDAVAVRTYNRYTDQNLACHIIGYLDSSKSSGVCGIEKIFDRVLKPSGSIQLTYSCDAVGRALCGVLPQIDASGYSDAGSVQLTLDSRIQSIAQLALKSSAITRGAICVLDVSTGEVIAMASAPEFSQQNPSEYLNDENSPFLNRALSAYNVGSVFKICVAAAALEKGVLPEQQYQCTGSVKSGVTISCHKDEGHGTLDMTQAMAQSCNVYFIKLALEIGAEAVYDMAQKLGFGEPITLCEDMTASYNFPELSELSSVDAALANLAIGQGALLSSPLHIARMTAAVACGGIKYEPSLIKKIMPSNGEVTEYTTSSSGERVFSKTTAEFLQYMMITTVTSGTGAAASPDMYTAGGKTATAQTGIISSDGESVTQAWFAGFYPAEKPTYSICVLCEDASSGSADAAPIFKKFCDELSKTLYIPIE